MKRLLRKHYIWHHHVHNVKFQSLQQAHLQTPQKKQHQEVALHRNSTYRAHWLIL